MLDPIDRRELLDFLATFERHIRFWDLHMDAHLERVRHSPPLVRIADHMGTLLLVALSSPHEQAFHAWSALVPPSFDTFPDAEAYLDIERTFGCVPTPCSILEVDRPEPFGRHSDNVRYYRVRCGADGDGFYHMAVISIATTITISQH